METAFGIYCSHFKVWLSNILLEERYIAPQGQQILITKLGGTISASIDAVQKPIYRHFRIGRLAHRSPFLGAVYLSPAGARQYSSFFCLGQWPKFIS